MGRRLPSTTTTAISSINPVLSSCLFVGSVFITIAIVASLCAAHRSRKQPSPAHSSARKTQKPVREKEAAAAASPPLETTMSPSPDTVEEISLRIQEQLNSPKQKESSPSFLLKSKSKLSSTLSMRLPRSVSFSMSMSKTRTRKDGGKQPKEEDSLWKKTIILGERCKVPDEEDAIIYDDKGNRIAAYPPKTPRSLPVSRSNSYIDQESLPFK